MHKLDGTVSCIFTVQLTFDLWCPPLMLACRTPTPKSGAFTASLVMAFVQWNAAKDMYYLGASTQQGIIKSARAARS